MALNEVLRNADNISLPVPNGTKAGDAVVCGLLVGVAQTDQATTTNFGGGNVVGNASVVLKGSHRLPVTGAVTQIGSAVYIPAAGGALTTTVGSNVLFGYAMELKSSGTATITVRIARV